MLRRVLLLQHFWLDWLQLRVAVLSLCNRLGGEVLLKLDKCYS